MDMESILKQVDWLDEERRKDKNKLSSMDERLKAAEENIPPLYQQIKELNSELTRLNAKLGRMDHFDESMLQIRIDHKGDIDELEKLMTKRDEEIEKMRRAEIRALDSNIADIRKELEQIPDLQRNMKVRMEEELRISRQIDEVRNRIETVRRGDEEYTRSIRLLDDGRRQDSKRLTDLQGEVAAMRKHVDEQRGKIEMVSSSIKKLETRLNEMSLVETERREALNSFLENQALKEVERERVWKEWDTRFGVIESQTAEVENNLQALDSTHRSVKRTQQAVDELTQKVERRINEMTEIQRLSEERFRQEWVTFKADDQKRWTNYTLTMEEQRGESQRQQERLAEKSTHLEDELQEIKDLLYQMNELTEKRLQALLAMTHEWVSSYERSVGRAT
jgi:chromosome segregation ATPase